MPPILADFMRVPAKRRPDLLLLLGFIVLSVLRRYHCVSAHLQELCSEWPHLLILFCAVKVNLGERSLLM